MLKREELEKALTPDDIELIVKRGAPQALREDLVVARPDGCVFLTPKGIAFYSLACLHYAVPSALPKLKTIKDLNALELELMFARITQLTIAVRDEYEAGRTKVSIRDMVSAFLYGTVSDFSRAGHRYRKLSAAGRNVIGMDLARNRSHRSAVAPE